MWFGLTLNDSAKAPPFTFYYVSGIPLTSYTPWEPNQPNNYRNKQHCVHIENSGLWDDTQCWNSKPYVCEKGEVIRPLGYERVYLALSEVADTPFHTQGDDIM